MEISIDGKVVLTYGSFRKKAHLGSFPKPRYEIYKTDIKGLAKWKKLSLVDKFLKEIGNSDFVTSDLGAMELFNSNNIGNRTLKAVIMTVDKKTEIRYIYSTAKPPKP